MCYAIQVRNGEKVMMLNGHEQVFFSLKNYIYYVYYFLKHEIIITWFSGFSKRVTLDVCHYMLNSK